LSIREFFSRIVGIAPVLLVASFGALIPFARAHAADTPPSLLRNGGFEVVQDGQAFGWTTSTGGKAKWRSFTLEGVAEAQEGMQAVRIPAPAPGDLALLFQEIPAESLAPEQTLRLEVWGKAAERQQLQAVVSFKTAEGRRTVRVTHPGDGEWKRLSLLFDLPKSADLSTVTVELLVRAKGGSPVEVDGARLWHEEISPQYDLPESAHD
jgi:hypothetical protein